MLVLLSGVSGAGKDTIKRELIKRNKKVSEANLKVSDTFLFICFLILYPFVICYYKRNNTVAILK